MLYALRHYTLPLMMALSMHVAAVWALYQGWNPQKERLNFVQPQTVKASLVMLESKARVAAPPPVDTAKIQRQAQQRQEEQKAREAQAAQDKAAKEKAAKEAAQKEADRLAKAAREKAQQEAADAAEAERARQERLAQLSELAASSMEQAIEEESQDLSSGSEEAVVLSYHAAIYDLVRRNWSRPPSARTGMQARLQVELIPTGDVVAVTVVESSGNVAFDRAAEHAVRRAKRFEVPTENAIFERHFRRFYFLFQPEDLLR